MKIRNWFFTVIIMVGVSNIHAMDTQVQLPSAQVLKKYLMCRGLGFFAEDTGIHHFLADAQLSPIMIAQIVDMYLYQYIQNVYSRIEKNLPHDMTQLASLQGLANVTRLPLAPISNPIRLPRSIALDRLAILKSVLQEAPKSYDALVDFERMTKQVMNKRQQSQSKL